MTLAKQIEADLATRLADGTLGVDGLKLLPLAAHYGTSTRPIRIALARLRERNMLDGQIPQSGKRQPKSHEPIRPQQTHDDLTTRIAESLVQDALRDDDRFVREGQTAETYGVSTTVVREIFNRLVGQGMLEHVARRGWRVRKLTQKDLDDFIEVRESLEIKALRLAWDRIDREQFATFLDGNAAPASPRGKHKLDNGFHGEIIRRANNKYISEFFDRHGRFFDIVFQWEAHDSAAATQAVQQHRAIVRAILDRDMPKSEAALVDHIRHNHPILTDILNRKRGRQRNDQDRNQRG